VSQAGAAARIPIRIQAAYGAGSIADGVKNGAFNAFLLFYYTTVLGLPGKWSGFALLIALCLDAVTDPLVGSISDNFRARPGSLLSKLGRRHPFMFAAALPMGLCFYGLFAPPPGLPQWLLFVWLVFFSVAVRFFLTLYMVPSSALGPEISRSYDGRTTLVSWRWMLGWFGALSVPLFGWEFLFVDSATGFDGRFQVSNYHLLGIFCGVVVAAAIFISSLGTRRLIPGLMQPAQRSAFFSFRRFAGEAANALQNRSYRMLVFATLFLQIGIGVREVFETHMGTWFWEFSNEQLGAITGMLVFPVIAGALLAKPLSQLSDKRRTAFSLMAFACTWLPLMVLLRFLDWLPQNGDPRLFWLVAFHGCVLVLAAIMIGILQSSMIMDTVDENELETGKRQEGVFVSAISFTGKAVSGFGNFLGGYALDWIGLPQGADASSIVSPESIILLGIVAAPGPILFYFVNLFFLSRYRISRARYHQIATALQARRAQAATLPPTGQGPSEGRR